MRIIKWVVGLIIIGVLINFMFTSFVKSSKPPQVAQTTGSSRNARAGLWENRTCGA